MIGYFGKPMEKFFSNHAALEVYVAGDGVNTFSGEINSVGFCDKDSLRDMDMSVYDEGFMGEYNSYFDFTATYTLIPTWRFGLLFFDIAVRSYWEDYVPLSFFQTYTTDVSGEQVYDFDFFQFNIGTTQMWEIEAENPSVMPWLTFQRTILGANRPFDTFIYNDYYGLVTDLSDADSQEIRQTMYEAWDYHVIYPPRHIPLSQQAVVVHLDFDERGIFSSPTKIRRVSLAALSVPKNTSKEIGTRFSNSLYPYSRSGFYYDYSVKNPISIYRDSAPYLYLTKNSGIRTLAEREAGLDIGISMPINKDQVSDYKVTALQLWLRIDKPTRNISDVDSVVMFSLDGRTKHINFNVQEDSSGDRAYLFATDAVARTNFTKLSYYQDGIPVVTPYIEYDVWTCIGINFTESIDMHRHLGSLNLNQEATFNNVSFYRTSYLQDTQAINYRQWIRVRQNPTPRSWIYWRGVDPGPYQSWDDMYRLPEIQGYATSPDALYSAYTGTNREVVDDNHGVVITNDGVTILTGAEWVNFTKKPV
jgi:hypothetical protein